MILTDLPEVSSLSRDEKIQLVDELLMSVYSSQNGLEPDEEVKKSLDSRWANYLKNPSSALSMEEFAERMASLRA